MSTTNKKNIQNKDAERVYFDKICSERSDCPVNDIAIVKRIITFINDTTKYKKKSKHSILDVGCGIGEFGKELAKDGYKVIGVDISKKAVLTANLVPVKNFKAIEADIEKKKLFNANSLDVILCCAVLHHFPDLNSSTVLRNFRYWLKPNGFVVIWEPNGSNPVTQVSSFLRRFISNEDFATPNEINHSYYSYKKIFNKNGFTNTYATTMTDRGVISLPTYINFFVSIRELLFDMTKILPFPYNNSALFMIFKLNDKL